jgi:hypothetical protein
MDIQGNLQVTMQIEEESREHAFKFEVLILSISA